MGTCIAARALLSKAAVYVNILDDLYMYLNQTGIQLPNQNFGFASH